ncbi:hypothetical protein [Pseudomonas phage PMBT54]|nr:hypothetical protein [Pseudomonas phage PMBT54]
MGANFWFLAANSLSLPCQGSPQAKFSGYFQGIAMSCFRVIVFSC